MKTTRTTINVALLRQVEKVIKAEPLRLDMAEWLCQIEKDDGGPKCGTVGCIAGWTVILDVATANTGVAYRKALDVLSFANVADEARRILCLTEDQVSLLFYTDGWPYEFSNAYWEAEKENDHHGMADATIARIEHFIKTNGAE